MYNKISKIYKKETDNMNIVSLLLIDFADFIIQHRRRIFKGLFSKISSPQGEFIHIMVLTTEDSVQEVRYG